MKISTKANSRFLSQEDVSTPFVAIIQDVRIEKLKSNRGEEEKYVLYFTTGKPMVFNVVNRKALVAAYGDQSDAWIGNPVEIYVDPNVFMGSERTGGIRLRIPSAPRPVTGSFVPSAPAPIPASAPAPRRSLEQDHARALDGMNRATTRANLDEWAAWGKRLPLTPQQHEVQQDAYQSNLVRIATATTLGRPVGATP